MTPGWEVAGVQSVHLSYLRQPQDEQPTANALAVLVVRRRGEEILERREVLVTAGVLASMPGRVDAAPLHDGKPATGPRRVDPVDGGTA